MINDLFASVLAAERASRWVVSSTAGSQQAQADGQDPFRLEIPPLVGQGAHDIDGPTLEVLAGLYLIAQLESAGVLVAAELLVTHRASLDLTSNEAAQLLEQMAVEAREWIPVSDREQLFARVFGTPVAATQGQVVVNAEFAQLLAELCSAVDAYGTTATYLRPPVRQASAITRSVQRLKANLALRQYGSTLVAARRIASQVRESVEVLSHPGLIQLARGHTMWDVVRATWDPSEQPDLERLVTTGQCGQIMIGWTGMPDAESAPPPATVRDAAAQWLLAMGLTHQEVA